MNYAAKQTAPRTLTERDQVALLRATGERAGGLRDHLIIALALHAGLREHEIAALDVGDVASVGAGGWRPYVREVGGLRIWKGHARSPEDEQIVRLAGALRRKLMKYLYGRRPVARATALFPSRQNERISTRRIRAMFAMWQARVGIDRFYRFHDLRHTFCSRVYRESGHDVRAAMVLARHKRVETTLRYTHPTEDELRATIERASI